MRFPLTGYAFLAGYIVLVGVANLFACLFNALYTTSRTCTKI